MLRTELRENVIAPRRQARKEGNIIYDSKPWRPLRPFGWSQDMLCARQSSADVLDPKFSPEIPNIFG
jgi:hypothetical protein